MKNHHVATYIKYNVTFLLSLKTVVVLEITQLTLEVDFAVEV